MALNIENPEVEQLAREIADLTGVSTTAAVRRPLRGVSARRRRG